MKRKVTLQSLLLLAAISIQQGSTAQTTGGAFFTPTANMNRTRIFPPTASLDNGKVVLFGGREYNFVSSSYADVYDPVSQSYTETAMNYPHDGTAIIRLGDGTYMIAGGAYDLGVAPGYNTVERFDPLTGNFTPMATMSNPRMNCSGAELSNGKVLIAGGWYSASSATYGEIYDPTGGSFSATGALNTPRAIPLTLPTADGDAVVIGGMDYYGGPMFTQVEYYSSLNNTFSVFSSQLITDDPGWNTYANFVNKPVSDIRLTNGNYVFLAYRVTGSTVEYALITFNPVTESFAKVVTSQSLTGFGSSVSYQSFVVNAAENLVYLIGFDSSTDPYGAYVTTVDLSDGTVFYPQGVQTWTAGEYPMASYSLLPGNKILMTGISSTSGDYFHATDKSYVITPDPSLSGLKENSKPDISLYPNPASGEFRFRFPGKNLNAVLRDFSGRAISTIDFQQTPFYTFPLDKISAGTYLLTVSSEEGSATVRVEVSE